MPCVMRELVLRRIVEAWLAGQGRQYRTRESGG